MLTRLIGQEKFRQYCLAVINKINETNPLQVFYILSLPRNQTDQSEQVFWFANLAHLQKSGKMAQLVNKIRLLEQPTILRVQLSVL